MSKPLIVVTGKNGQLGYELEKLSASFLTSFHFLFADRFLLDLANPSCITTFFENHHPNYFINCAAYTAVDKAESEKELAYQINAGSVGEIASQCSLHNCKLITVSTDYVFNGLGTRPYQTDAITDPVNYYGYTKWMGEQLALENNQQTIVIRTSWVYSIHGNNFVKTMVRLMKERAELKVVSDQVGSPTYAEDLAAAILQIIGVLQNGASHFGVYHYSNTGVISWHEFATTIRDLSGFACKILPIPTSAYPTPAKRPAYSVLDKTTIIADFGLQLKEWKDSLQRCLLKLT